MSLRLLADENVDHRVVHRLRNYGHDVVHVDFVDELGKGTPDAEIASHARETDRVLLSNDDDFLTDFGTEDYPGLLFIEDETLGPATVADVVDAIGTATDGVSGIFYASRNWL